MIWVQIPILLIGEPDRAFRISIPDSSSEMQDGTAPYDFGAASRLQTRRQWLTSASWRTMTNVGAWCVAVLLVLAAPAWAEATLAERQLDLPTDDNYIAPF
jgi:hypothetical protein